jgi:hypothetical protein
MTASTAAPGREVAVVRGWPVPRRRADVPAALDELLTQLQATGFTPILTPHLATALARRLGGATPYTRVLAAVSTAAFRHPARAPDRSAWPVTVVLPPATDWPDTETVEAVRATRRQAGLVDDPAPGETEDEASRSAPELLALEADAPDAPGAVTFCPPGWTEGARWAFRYGVQASALLRVALDPPPGVQAVLLDTDALPGPPGEED